LQVVTGATMTEPLPTTKSRLRLRLGAAAARQVRAGHPWVFAPSVREQNRDGITGELAALYDARDRFLALGLFDAGSPLRVRVLHAGRPVTVDADWWRARWQAAVTRRAGLFDEQTTGYRLVHGESDGWPGLVLDRYGDTFVLKLYTAAWLPRLSDLQALIEQQLRPGGLILRLSRNLQEVARREHGMEDGRALLGGLPAAPVRFRESGLWFEADVVRGQKTGFFLDQRENRRRVGQLAAGRHVLNVFSFSGGFSLYAARGGAASVTDLDISEHALKQVRRNFALNQALPGVAACRQECVRADAFRWLARAPDRKFGLIVLDPPSLAKRAAERAGAVEAYRRLNAAVLRWLAPGGLLVAASCSAHVRAAEFFEAVRRGARAAGRRFTELETTGHPPDHPATFPEAEYLKAIFLRC
jgi:23S rRNA (cytosine1962-C5)-methyltransferase